MDSTCKPLEDTAELSALTGTLAATLKELDDATLRLKDMQASLQEFLAEYYQRVGPLVARLQALGAARAGGRDGPGGFAPQAPPAAPASSEYRRELKRLYRQLARACHPDSGTAAASGDYMRVVNHAYQQQNLASLWKLSLALLPQPDGDALHRQLASIRTVLVGVQTAVTQLEASNEYRLMQRAFFARLSGQDLVHTIERELAQRVEKEERRATLAQLMAPLRQPSRQG